MRRRSSRSVASCRAGRGAGPGIEALERRVLLSADSVILGDYNGNGQVEQGDLDLVLQNWGTNFFADQTAVPSAWLVDLPSDTIDQEELDGVLQFWGTTVPGGAVDGGLTGLASGQTIDAVLGTANDVDTYTIDLDAGDTLLVTVAEVTNTFGTMRATLFAPDNTIVERSNFGVGGDVDQFDVAQGGTYKLVVSSVSGSGAYRLTPVVVDDVVDVDNVPLTSGQTLTGTIDVADIDTFTIDAQAGDSLLVTVAETANFFNFMRTSVFAPDGSLLETVTFATGGDADQFDLPQSGTYTIVVQDRDDDFTGGYNITAVLIDGVVDADNVALTSGQTTAGSIGIADIDTFTIDAQAGDSLLLTVAETANFFTFMRASVFAPDGSLLETATFAVGNDLDQLNLTQSGTYTIVVQDRDDGFTGDYNVTAVVIDGALDADNVALTSGLTTAGAVGVADIDTFTIDAQAGDSILVTIAEDTNVFTFMEARIFAPDGTLLETQTFATGDDLDQIAVAQTGTYTIAVRDRDDDLTGGYFITAVVIDDVVDTGNVALTSGQATVGTVGVGDIDTFTIDVDPNDDLLISIAEVLNTFTFMEASLFGPDGALIETDTFAAAGDLDQFSVVQGGTYTIVVRDRDDDSTGDYTITATAMEPPA